MVRFSRRPSKLSRHKWDGTKKGEQDTSSGDEGNPSDTHVPSDHPKVHMRLAKSCNSATETKRVYSATVRAAGRSSNSSSTRIKRGASSASNSVGSRRRGGVCKNAAEWPATSPLNGNPLLAHWGKLTPLPLTFHQAPGCCRNTT
jgi:hypothetical protein